MGLTPTFSTPAVCSRIFHSRIFSHPGWYTTLVATLSGFWHTGIVLGHFRYVWYSLYVWYTTCVWYTEDRISVYIRHHS